MARIFVSAGSKLQNLERISIPTVLSMPFLLLSFPADNALCRFFLMHRKSNAAAFSNVNFVQVLSPLYVHLKFDKVM